MAEPALAPLEIVEWGEFPYANPADPQNADTHVEILVHNPNNVPVRIDRDDVELRFVNGAGETVYSNPNPFFYIWEGSWIRDGETVPISACACFQSSGLAKQDWEKLELTVPLQAAPEIPYTTNVTVTMGDFFSLAEAHLGGDSLGAEITFTNSSDQVLRQFEIRVIARDANSKYVGVAMWGSVVDYDEYRNPILIEPGMSGSGILVSEIDYVDIPLEYEIIAIGIPATP